MVGLIIATSLFAIIAWILFTPIILSIDSESHIYEVRFGGLAQTWIDTEEHELTFHLKLPIYHYRKQLLGIQSSAQKKDKETKPQSFSFKKACRFKNILKSFHIETFAASLDTDNYMLNAQLLPIGILLTNRGFPIYINFQGKSYLILEIRNTLWRIFLAYSNLRKY
ncbi:MAG: hypothetical protein ABJG47_17380 [Ekhidna sp.]